MPVTMTEVLIHQQTLPSRNHRPPVATAATPAGPTAHFWLEGQKSATNFSAQDTPAPYDS